MTKCFVSLTMHRRVERHINLRFVNEREKKTLVITKDFWSQKPNIRNDKSKFFKKYNIEIKKRKEEIRCKCMVKNCGFPSNSVSVFCLSFLASTVASNIGCN